MRSRRAIPEIRRGKWSPPFDTELWPVGEQLRQPGEYSVVTKLCNYKGHSIHFVVLTPMRVWSDANYKSFVRPLLAMLAALALMLQVNVHFGWLILVAVVGSLASVRYAIRTGRRLMRLWENCTGFLVLDRKGRPMRNIPAYHDYFKAFATWEDAYLRPVVLQRLSKRTLESSFKMMRQITAAGKRVQLASEKRLDQQVSRMHLALSKSEERLADQLQEEQTLSAEINNLLYQISEDMQIRRVGLIRKLTRLKRVEEDLASLLESRSEEYEYWLELLDAKGFRVRFTRWGSILAGVGGVFSALLSGRPYPLLLLFLPLIRYGIDFVGGVRGLRRKAVAHAKAAKKLDAALARLDPPFKPNLVRLPA